MAKTNRQVDAERPALDMGNGSDVKAETKSAKHDEDARYAIACVQKQAGMSGADAANFVADLGDDGVALLVQLGRSGQVGRVKAIAEGRIDEVRKVIEAEQTLANSNL